MTTATGEEVNVLPPPPPATTKWGKMYRSALFQVCVVSALAFCGPAMADAISGLGGGGQATPYTVSAYMFLITRHSRDTLWQSRVGPPLTLRRRTGRILLRRGGHLPLWWSPGFPNGHQAHAHPRCCHFPNQRLGILRQFAV